MEFKKLKIWYENHHQDQWDQVEEMLYAFDEFLSQQTITEEKIQSFIEVLRAHGKLNEIKIYGLARYFKLCDHDVDSNKHYVYMTKLLGGEGVLESMAHQAKSYMSSDQAEEIFISNKPALATDPKKMPHHVVDIMTELNGLGEDKKRAILAGNHHQIPRQAFLKDKEVYESMPSLEAYLEHRHHSKIKELEEYCKNQEVWFEQIITQEVIDHVKSSQEILSAVKVDNSLYVTKIPYDTVNYLKAENDDLKRYHYCHCPFVKESILGHEVIDDSWCYCSGGFAKFPFEVILGKKLKVELLESVIKGDLRCRFKIDLE